ncbi:hypothetical protein EXN66_Car001722 [Channa argus]|uniref:Uncharacterized protein n=1 Tax=Channa argus TaxID=215402 RepID=A0A6G1R263_CHAAH|nr:hypothetical protein EXN66_Car001722 [Channa argus]
MRWDPRYLADPGCAAGALVRLRTDPDSETVKEPAVTVSSGGERGQGRQLQLRH